MTAQLNTSRRPSIVYIGVVLLLFVAFGAIPASVMFITDPSGASLGLPLEWINQSVFGNYLLPGIVLFVMFGLGSLAAAFGVWRRQQWSWMLTVLLGLALMIWIVVQYFTIQTFFFLQPVMFITGLLIAALPFVPAMRRYYQAD